MGKALCIFGLVAALILLFLFGMDAALGILRIENIVVDVAFIVCAVVLAYLSWASWREQP